MLRIWLKNQQIEHPKKLEFRHSEFLISPSLHYQVMSKNVFVETQKPQLCYCPNGLLVKHSAFQAECPGSNPTCANFYIFPKLFFAANWHLSTRFWLLLIEARAKQYWSIIQALEQCAANSNCSAFCLTNQSYWCTSNTTLLATYK